MKYLTFTFSLLLCVVITSFAQVTPITGNFIGVAGVETDVDGNAWVTETGSGTNNGRVTRVKPNGDKAVIVTGLPSNTDTISGETGGPWRTMLLPNNRIAVLVGEGPTRNFGRILFFNLTGFQAGVSPAKTIADTTSSIDISRFSLAQTGVTNSNPFSAVLDVDGSWYVADAGANMIIKVSPTGVRSVFARFPKIPNPTPVGPPVVDAVPTKILINPDGGFYVCTLTGFPFNAGQAAVYNVDKNGVITPYIKGMTLLTDMALDTRTGDIYALQFADFSLASASGFIFGSAKVHRIPRGGAFSEVVARDFGPGAGLSLDKSGNLYMTSLFTGQLFKMNSPTCGNFDIAITADNNTLSLYSSIKYTLKVTNKGTTAQNNVRVFWLPPYKRFEGDAQPFAYQSASASKGNYDAWHGYWTINSLAAGESATATFQLFVVNDRIDATQSAQVVACNQRPSSGSAFEPGYSVTLTTKANTQLQYTDGTSRDPEYSGEGGHFKSQPFNISPNPANEKFVVSPDIQTQKAWQIQLINSVGQVVLTRTGAGTTPLEIATSDFAQGIYILDYQSDATHWTKKLVIHH